MREQSSATKMLTTRQQSTRYVPIRVPYSTYVCMQAAPCSGPRCLTCLDAWTASTQTMGLMYAFDISTCKYVFMQDCFLSMQKQKDACVRLILKQDM